LKDSGFKNVYEVDSSNQKDRGEIIKCFSPYYNDSTTSELESLGEKETRILISTDVLSEGLNLQDAMFLINYDLHWNPVRLMQRIGRVDRRLDKDTEENIIKDHPEQKEVRGKIQYWNFLPPEELNHILSLYQKVTNKTLKISKTFGIEGKKLLTPEDDYEALKEFNQGYEGTVTLLEKMRLEYQDLLKQDEELIQKLNGLPLKIFSGKLNPEKDVKAVFFCYLLPAKDVSSGEWTDEAGFTRWYLYDVDTKKIVDEPTEILNCVKCNKKTAIKRSFTEELLKDIRIKMDEHVTKTYMRSVQAPQGVEFKLKAWMELS